MAEVNLDVAMQSTSEEILANLLANNSTNAPANLKVEVAPAQNISTSQEVKTWNFSGKKKIYTVLFVASTSNQSSSLWDNSIRVNIDGTEYNMGHSGATTTASTSGDNHAYVLLFSPFYSAVAGKPCCTIVKAESDMQTTDFAVFECENSFSVSVSAKTTMNTYSMKAVVIYADF